MQHPILPFPFGGARSDKCFSVNADINTANYHNKNQFPIPAPFYFFNQKNKNTHLIEH